MTERENFLIAYHHGKPAWMPNFYDAYAPVGASVLNNQGDYMKGGKDMFGAKWICTKDARRKHCGLSALLAEQALQQHKPDKDA